MFSIANYYKNANQNYNEKPPHTSQNGHHQNMNEEMSIDRWMGKDVEVHTDDGILVNHKMEQIWVCWNEVD